MVLEEIEKLYESLKDNELLTLFVKFALTAGGRLETILNIQKKDIDLTTNTINLLDLKNHDTYKGFLSNELAEEINQKLKDLKANDYIISLDGTKLTSKQIKTKTRQII